MEHIQKDVVVIGGGPGGLAAAVSAAREGAKVLLVERNGYLGGQLGSGLPFLAFWDRKKRQVIGGIAQEFVDRLAEVDGTKGHAYCPFHLSTTMIHPFYSRIIAFQMVKEAGVDLLLHSELTGVKVENGKIQSVTVTGKGCPIEISADVFIDGTGDGDLGYMSGAECQKGQADTHVMQPPTLMFNLAGIDFDRFCDFIEEHPEELPYGLKTMENVREGYDAEFFRTNPSFIFFGMQNLLRKLREEGKCPIARDTIIFIRQPIPGEVAVNTIRLLNFDGSDVHDLSNGEMEAHLQIPILIQLFKDYVPGFENCYLTSINACIGVRESRRIVGKKMLDHHDCIDGLIPNDTVALCSYFLDIHNGNGDNTTTINVEPFGIPYLCLVSKDVDNLMMAGRDISMDAQAFGATRIMNVCMAVGEAAGVAAAMSVAKKCEPDAIDVQELREKLLEKKAILSI